MKLRYKRYYNQRLLLAAGRFYVALNCSHYNRIMIKRLRHYLDK
ncbi:hypothetical protein T11_1489 [Trichinella zimbabwensis]|uniref:Uncharacterized protein n=1 Tax=Trichinella zimbabwensis TaxID=268475 RepID=A0A0V1G937_9BILA|nr:hypothetical protein T11_1489 [Trichinella zimbabwensis]